MFLIVLTSVSGIVLYFVIGIMFMSFISRKYTPKDVRDVGVFVVLWPLVLLWGAFNAFFRMIGSWVTKKQRGIFSGRDEHPTIVMNRASRKGPADRPSRRDQLYGIDKPSVPGPRSSMPSIHPSYPSVQDSLPGTFQEAYTPSAQPKVFERHPNAKYPPPRKPPAPPVPPPPPRHRRGTNHTTKLVPQRRQMNRRIYVKN